MPVTGTDSILGVPYLAYDRFRERAELFGCGMAMANFPDTDPGNTKLVAVLAAASRAIDSACGRNFLSGNLTENHAWNPTTRRTRVNMPPVLSLVSYAIRLSPSTVATFNIADVYVNNQENYIELLSLASAGSLTPMLASFGLMEPQVEIVYTSYASVPVEVVQACGFQTAFMINEGFVNQMVPQGFGSLDLGGIKASNQTTSRMPANVRDLLGDYIRIPIA
jgi:hypothetical protein